MNIIKEENNELKIEIDKIKKENNEVKFKIENQNKKISYLNKYIIIHEFKSVIIKDDEKDMIFKEIENKMNKSIKEIKNLYQATIDGGDPINFHKKCDNIPNTLVFIKSEGNRRFGGFTSIPWKSEKIGIYLKDTEKKTFIFSLDNKELYDLEENRPAVYHNKKYGPCFGEGFDIGIEGNPIKEKTLYTCQTGCYDYKGNNLSEYEFPNNIMAIEYEVFQIIFH